MFFLHLHYEKFLQQKDIYRDLKLDILELLVCNTFLISSSLSNLHIEYDIVGFMDLKHI